jgi:uncharacterized protein YjiS (DUF1127 family)
MHALRSPALSGRKSLFLDRLWRFLDEHRARRLAIRQLRNLDDRYLRDLGIERQDIAALVDREVGRFRPDEFRSRG